MSDLTHLLFWIDQEPVESEVEIYLPADTPIQRPSAKVLHQMQKARQIKHNRETRRLKTVYYERLKAIKRDLAKGVQRHLLPKFPSTPSKIDILSGTEFINQNQKQIVELLNFARSVK
ncbi:uncharacterized protein B0P05DRAFT_459400, partial [Gilbertella persicaria]|uniref:uncharacterized protein n=1 Tax=Gilbertella persicaria TaxID=101096 RepID=UPI00221FDAFE